MDGEQGTVRSRRTGIRERTQHVIETRARFMQIEDIIRDALKGGATAGQVSLRLMREGWYETIEDARQHVESFQRVDAEQRSRIVTRARRAAVGEASVLLLGLILIGFVFLAGLIRQNLGLQIASSALFFSLGALCTLVRLYSARNDEMKLEKITPPSDKTPPGREGPESLSEIQALYMTQASQASLQAQDAGIRPM